MTTPSEKHHKDATEALMAAITASRVHGADEGIFIIAAALASAERDGYKRGYSAGELDAKNQRRELQCDTWRMGRHVD